MAFGRAIDPRTGSPLAQAVVLSGGVIPPCAQANVAGGLTVKAPGAAGRYDGAPFMVQRSGGSGTITIDGDGVTLDGSATAVMAADENLRFYIYDATAGQWTRALVPRSSPGLGEPVLLASELPSSAAGWTFTAGSQFGLLWSPVDNALRLPLGLGFNETWGYYFHNFAPMRCLGVRFSSGPTGSGKTFLAKLWNSNGPVELAAQSQIAVSNNEDMRILFAAPITLDPSQTTGVRYVASVYCSVGGGYMAFSNETFSTGLNIGSVPPAASWPLYVAPRLIFNCFAWTGGNGFPSTPNNNTAPAIEPILEYV